MTTSTQLLKRHRIFWMLAAIALLYAPVEVARASTPTGTNGTLDQSNTTADNSTCAWGAFYGQQLAQTFTAGLSGPLGRVDLLLSRSSTPPENLTVNIESVTGDDLPTGTVLATTSIAPTDVPMTPASGYVSATFTSPATVAAGAQYAIVAIADNSPDYADYAWGCSLANPYAGGNGSQNAWSTGWSHFTFSGTVDVSGTDFGFDTYVKATYSWSGVLQPINSDGSSIFKLGSTVPVKFQLTGSSAGITNLAALLTDAKVSNSIEGTYAEAATNVAATSGNAFRYDTTSGQYIFNWSTKGLTTGTYRLKLDLGDGATHTVDVSLK